MPNGAAATGRRRRALTITAILLLAMLVFAGVAIAAEPKDDEEKIPPPPDCPEGKKAVWIEAALFGGKSGWVCVDVEDPQDPAKECPEGFHFDGTDCVANDPNVVDPPDECPDGKVWNATLGQCEDIQKPGECPPGQVWIKEFETCIDEELACGEGQHWDATLGKCVDDVPPPPDCPSGKKALWFPVEKEWGCVDEDTPVVDEECPDGYVWNASLKKCVVTVKPVIEDPNDYIKTYPTGRNFYQVVQGDIAYGTSQHSIVYRYLLTEGYLAAKEQGLSDEDAGEFSKIIAKNADNRIAAWNLITCANEAWYGTYGYNPEFEPDPGPNGLAIRLVPQHADNLSRLINNKTLARCIKLGTKAKKGDGSGVRVNNTCHSFELLWMPGINREELYTSVNLTTGRTTLTTNGMKWPDGSTMGLPPPFIIDKGATFFTGSVPDPPPLVWGCMGIILEIVPE